MTKKLFGVILIFLFIFVSFFVVLPVFAVAPPDVTSISPAIGPTAGGTSVIITGTGFASGTVTIGGASATNIIIVNTTQITATTPAGTAGAQDVVFTRTSDGKFGTLTGGFTYIAPLTIMASVSANGSISPSGAVSINYGASQSFTITPDAGYHIADVLVDSVSVGAVTSYNFTNVIADHTIAATFTINPSGETPPPPAERPTASPSVQPTTAVFSGQAYPGSKIEILRKSIQEENYKYIPVENLTISDEGIFYASYIYLMQDDYFFALRAEDKDGRKTGIISFNVNLLEQNKLSAENIFVPPTIDIQEAAVVLGKEIKTVGYAAPERKIEVEIDNIIAGETQSDKNGYWAFATSTASLRIGNHYIKTRQVEKDRTSSFDKLRTSPFDELRTSGFSLPRTFKVSLLTSPKADFNNDDKVNISDWSIFLFRWGSTDKTLRLKADMNDDGKIDISDFSIFLKSMQI